MAESLDSTVPLVAATTNGIGHHGMDVIATGRATEVQFPADRPYRSR